MNYKYVLYRRRYGEITDYSLNNKLDAQTTKVPDNFVYNYDQDISTLGSAIRNLTRIN